MSQETPPSPWLIRAWRKFRSWNRWSDYIYIARKGEFWMSLVVTNTFTALASAIVLAYIGCR